MLLFCTLAVWGAPVSTMRRVPEMERSLLDAANRDRAARGLPQLRGDSVLAQAAHYHAQLMAERGEISHQFAGEPDVAQRGARVGGRFSRITENVAEVTNPSSLHTLWMNSPGHRANLLDPKVNVVGIAVVALRGQFYAVEDFAETVESMSFGRQEATVGRLLADAGLAVGADGQTATLAQARTACAASSGFAGSRRPLFLMRYSAPSLDRLPSELEQRIQSGRYRQAVVGACRGAGSGGFSTYNIAVLLYP